MRSGVLRILMALVASACPLRSQPEAISHESPITFSSRVNLVSVPVVVRDQQGQAVGNLRREDFRIFDKGKLQVITKFLVEDNTAQGLEGGAASPDISSAQSSKGVLPDRYVAYIFDDLHLKPSELLQSRQAVTRQLNESSQPNTRTAIFTTSGKMVADFTDDADKLRTAVNSLKTWAGGPDSHDCPTMSYYVADYLVNKAAYLDAFVYSDEQLVSIAGTDQIFRSVYAESAKCEGVSVDPAQPLDPLRIGRMRDAAHRVLEYYDRDTTLALQALKGVVRRVSLAPGSRSIVLLSPGFLLTKSGDHGSQEFDVVESAIRGNVTLNTIDVRGLRANPGADASERGYQAGLSGVLLQSDIAEASQKSDVLSEVAAGTGGTVFRDDNGLKEGLERITAKPEFVYILGYSPEELKYDGAYHRLKVTLRNQRGLSVSSRLGYWMANHEVSPAEQAREEIREAMFSREETNQIPVDLQTEFFKSSDEAADLTVTVHLILRDFQFKKVDDRNNDTLTVVTGLFDPDGNYVSGIQKVIEMHLRDQTRASLEKTGITVKESFNVAVGRYFVRVVARDVEGKTMAARNAGVEIQ